MKTNTDYKTLAVYGSQNDVMEIKFNGGDKRIVNILGCVYVYYRKFEEFNKCGLSGKTK